MSQGLVDQNRSYPVIRKYLHHQGSHCMVPRPKEKGKQLDFQTKKSFYSHAEMLQAGKCELPFFQGVSISSLRKRTKDILINKLKDTHEPVRKSILFSKMLKVRI